MLARAVSLFPPTRHSVLDDLRGADVGRRRAAQEALARAYLRPGADTPSQSTGGGRPRRQRSWPRRFFRSVVERGLLESYDTRRARLRTYLRLCVDALVDNADVAGQREKRGGGMVSIPLEEMPEGMPAGESPDALFEREWRRTVFSLAVDRTRTHLLAQERAGTGRCWRASTSDGSTVPGPPTPSWASSWASR